MELVEGFPLLLQQFAALFRKNFLLSCRSMLSTILQLFSSLLFISLMFCIQKTMDSSFSSIKADPNPTVLVAPTIPACEDKSYLILPCYDFVYSGNGTRIRQIVESIRRNNPGRPIPQTKVKAFGSRVETDDWLLRNPLRTNGALHFIDRNATVISYGLQTNSTTAAGLKRQRADPTFTFQIPLQLAAEREIARVLIGDAGFSWVVSLKKFPHPQFDRKDTSVVQLAGKSFFLAMAMFSFLFQLRALTTEKELKLRQAMAIMGLYDTAYWLSWFSWEGIMTLLSSLFTVLFGFMFPFDFFRHNNFAIVFLLFFLFQLNMTAFAFMLSTFISKSASSTTVGFFVFITGFMTQLVTTSGFPYSADFSKTIQIIWSFFPPNIFAEGLTLLSKATATPKARGISWSTRMKCPPNYKPCFYTISDIYKWLGCTLCLWLVLAIYLDNILPNPSGVRKSVFYFLNPRYWFGEGRNKYQEGSICSCCRNSVPPLEDIVPDDVDVLEEEDIVKQQAKEGNVDASIAVQVRGLVKIYAGTTRIGCCRCTKTAPFQAVKSLWLNFPKDQLFCLLGPNGAGKTTTIDCLTGITPVTSGDALIYGHSIRNTTGMLNIRKIIGVCPQFDILWDALSGKEHLQLFARIKGLPQNSVESVVEKLLAKVKLTVSGKIRAASYSGGMRRCISLAIALIGEPKLLILDEPTTGMDPVTRRHVWDVIQWAKIGRAIILTTHSMEEADVLGDKIGIMAKGRLRCIGTSIRLKSRFGTGFVSNISFSSDAIVQHTAVIEFFKYHLDISPKEKNKSFLTFVIPHEKEKLLKNFFSALQKRVYEFGITDIQLGLATLEEVFLSIANKAELDAAAAEGKFKILTINSGRSYQVLVGGRYIGLPGTETQECPRGLMVEVYWQQDDSGDPCIWGHSKEVPIPDRVQLQTPSTTAHTRTISGRRRHGIVIDPSQIHESDFL